MAEGQRDPSRAVQAGSRSTEGKLRPREGRGSLNRIPQPLPSRPNWLPTLCLHLSGKPECGVWGA